MQNIVLKCSNQGCKTELNLLEMKDHHKRCELNQPLLEQQDQKKKQVDVVRDTFFQRLFGNRAPQLALPCFSETEQFNSGESTEPYTVFEAKPEEVPL